MTSDFSDDSMQPKSFPLLETLQKQTRSLAKTQQFIVVVAMYVAIAEPIENGRFNLVYKPVKQHLRPCVAPHVVCRAESETLANPITATSTIVRPKLGKQH